MGNAFGTSEATSTCADTSVEELDDAFQDLHVALARWRGRTTITSDVHEAMDSLSTAAHAACVSAAHLSDRVKRMLETLPMLIRADADQRSEIEARIMSLAIEAYYCAI